MHYYQKNIGNYGRDTGHLTALEHGVYNLLLDWYYLNERPITIKEAVRVSRGNPEETQVVLSEFFKETKDGWIHSYADRVIAEYHAKAERNRVNGAKGGRPKSTQVIDSNGTETQVVLSGMPKVTLTHKPLTNNQEETKEKKSASPTGSRLPADWTLPDDWRDWAIGERPDVNPVTEAAIFHDYWISVAGAKGRKADWLATWRGWIRRTKTANGNWNSGGHADQQKRRKEL